MQTQPRTRMAARERRQQLLDVTKEIVGERGLHAVTIEGVARRAGVTRPVVYDHFGDLPSMLESMLERESARALMQLAQVLPADPEDGDPRRQLIAALTGYLLAVRADPVTWRLVLMPPDGAPEMLRDRINRGRDAVVALLAEVVGRSGIAPGLTSPDPGLTARLLSAAADEAARLMLTAPDEYPVERLVGQVRWLLDQLGSP